MMLTMYPIRLHNNIFFLCISFAIVCCYLPNLGEAGNSKLFREYIGAESTGVKLSDVPINSNLEFHFILSFAIDYTTTTSQTNPNSTNGDFNIFWDSGNITSHDVASIKANHSNVKVALSIGGDTIGNTTFNATFTPVNVTSWVNNAVNSLTEILKEYHLDGIDIDYEHFDNSLDPHTFADCIGQLISSLKEQKVISFASIAPFDDDDEVEAHYVALWNKYGWLIDYVNFQFYAYDNTTTVPQFLNYFEEQRSKYEGGKILASIATDGISGGLSPENGFFEACKQLKDEEKLHGIFIWSADDSFKANFTYEKQAQYLLAAPLK